MPRQIQGSQRDFSFGEIDLALKRSDDHPARKAGLRQMANARILNSGAVQNRSGRRALYPVAGNRTERFAISAGNIFDIQFGAGLVQIINSAGVVVGNFTLQGSGAALPWTANNLNTIVHAIFNRSIYITFGHAMRPQVITWDGVSTWSIADYAEAISTGGQKRTPFYRISPQNITLLPSAVLGAITVQFSSPIVVAGMVGTRVRFAGRQILLGTVIDASNMNATVIEPLPIAQILALASSTGNFAIGDVIVGANSSAKGIVISSPTAQSIFGLSVFTGAFVVADAVTGGTSGATGVVTAVGINSFGNGFISVSLSTGTAFAAVETITGPHGSFTSSAVTPVNMTVQVVYDATGATNFFRPAENIFGQSGSANISTATATTPKAVSVWDDEIMNGFRGYPGSCFVDQFRLGFCDFPSVPGGIGWSAINSPTDLNIGPNPSDAMFEIAPDKVQVRYVVAGPESSEFVFCDSKIYYIPISPTNPLRPGSVAFQLLSGDGSAQVQPRISQETIIYANAGQSSVMAIIASGAYLRPFNTKNLSDFHGHLFSGITAIAVPNADGAFNERYAYVLNGDGSIAVGKYNPESLQGNLPVIGWGPWSGAGAVHWIAANAADVLFTTGYPVAAGTSLLVEILDDAQYLDCAVPVNAVPAIFAPPAGKGPLWFFQFPTVTLIDQGTRVLGTYLIDANGFIVPQNNGGEDLTRASLIAGQPWTMTVEPFAPDAQSGADMHQRMMKRRISNFAAYVINSTGFTLQKLFSRKETATSPALGTAVAIKRVPSWNMGEDATLPPKQRETMESWRPSGHSFDPRVAIIKDSPGPLQIIEFGMEVTL